MTIGKFPRLAILEITEKSNNFISMLTAGDEKSSMGQAVCLGLGLDFIF